MKRLGILAIGVALLAAGCGGEDSFTAQAGLTNSAFNVSRENYSIGSDCPSLTSTPVGSEVVLKSSSGAKVAVTRLDSGSIVANDSDAEMAMCRYQLTWTDVPSGQGPYTIEYSGAEKTYSEDELSSGSVELVFG